MPRLAKEQLLLYGIKPKSSLVQPFLKWAGGKRQLWPFIKNYLPEKFGTYYEPFLGAGAVLFSLQPSKAVVNDINTELINCYEIIKTLSLDLIQDLQKHTNTEEYFYKIREADRKSSFADLSNVERASRVIYLNKTCYNGLFRVNRNGQFNAPFGDYKNPNIVNSEVIKAVSRYLNSNDITILNGDFKNALSDAKRGDFIYLDPPYDPLSSTSSFTGYSLEGFGKNEQQRLKDLFEELTLKGCLVMMSNSSTPYIYELYQEYNIIKVPASRNINSNGEERRKIEELLILNYPISNEK
jgi:DNA adenine methylase